ncbi:MAG: hypothetical protein KBF98_01675 [Rhodoferax sp.]|nr:hypothetical protein [Rhodoferax sp.]
MLRQLKRCDSPSWLADLTPDAIRHEQLPLLNLLRDSVYYPSCGFDSDPIRHLGGSVFSFVYVDYGLSREAFVKALHFCGYDLVASRFVADTELAPAGRMPLCLRHTDGDPMRYSDHVKVPFCLWSVFQRRSNFGVAHGPTRFSLLFVCADGVSTFQTLYVANSVAPKVVAVIQPGQAFGYNWTDFTDSEQIFCRVVLENHAGQPDLLLYGGMGRRDYYRQPCWPSFQNLIRLFYRKDGGSVGVWVK